MSQWSRRYASLRGASAKSSRNTTQIATEAISSAGLRPHASSATSSASQTKPSTRIGVSSHASRPRSASRRPSSWPVASGSIARFATAASAGSGPSRPAGVMALAIYHACPASPSANASLGHPMAGSRKRSQDDTPRGRSRRVARLIPGATSHPCERCSHICVSSPVFSGRFCDRRLWSPAALGPNTAPPKEGIVIADASGPDATPTDRSAPGDSPPPTCPPRWTPSSRATPPSPWISPSSWTPPS